jgi:DnaK suppressor protein
MDANKMDKYQEELVRLRQQTLKRVQQLEEENKDVTADRHGDWLDQAWDENEIRLLDQLKEDCSVELARIERALRGISTGTYGRCVGCRQPIEERRLDVFPEADFCCECQDMREGLERV